MCKSSEAFLGEKKEQTYKFGDQEFHCQSTICCKAIHNELPFSFGIVVILGFALIPSTYSVEENQFIKWKM